LRLSPASGIGTAIVAIKAEGRLSAERINADGPRSHGYQLWLGRSRDKDRTVGWTAATGSNSEKTIMIPALDMVVPFNASRVSKNMVAPEVDLLDEYILPPVTEPRPL
jgi:hypothetical protein